NGFALNGGFEPDALDFELLDETLTDAADHIINQSAAEPMEGFNLIIPTLATDDEFSVFEFDAGATRQFPIQFAFGTFDERKLAFHGELGDVALFFEDARDALLHL